MLRCHWSPDGAYIVSAHAMNNSGPTAQIIERDGFKTSLDFVGHRKAITVVVSVVYVSLLRHLRDKQVTDCGTCLSVIVNLVAFSVLH